MRPEREETEKMTSLDDLLSSAEENQQTPKRQPAAQKPAQVPEDEDSSIIKIMEEFTSDESDDERVNWSLSSVLGGDILSARWFLRHLHLILLIIVLLIIYISNRYAAQQKLIKIDALKKELIDKRYNAQTRSAELMQRCKQSQIAEGLKAQGDSTLLMTSEPPFEFVIKHQ